MYHIQVFS